MKMIDGILHIWIDGEWMSADMIEEIASGQISREEHIKYSFAYEVLETGIVCDKQ